MMDHKGSSGSARAWVIVALVAVTAAAACESRQPNVANGAATETKSKVDSTAGDVSGNDSLQTRSRTDSAPPR
jgi:hypothetical protein